MSSLTITLTTDDLKKLAREKAAEFGVDPYVSSDGEFELQVVSLEYIEGVPNGNIIDVNFSIIRGD